MARHISQMDHCGDERRDRHGHVVATCSAHLHPDGTEHYDRDTGAVWTGEQPEATPGCPCWKCAVNTPGMSAEEAALRERIATEIEAEADRDPYTFGATLADGPTDPYVTGVVMGKRRAAIIARGRP